MVTAGLAVLLLLFVVIRVLSKPGGGFGDNLIGRTIWIRAGRNIEAGEELTYDYYTDGDQIIECRCRPGCTRKL